MCFIKYWQLVAHSPKLSPAAGSIAGLIAMRIKKGKDSERIPQRTLYIESPGISSKRTIRPVLEQLIAAGVIAEHRQPEGSRKSSLITWTLECPPGCQIDHYGGNTKLKKQPPESSKNSPEMTSSETADCPTTKTADCPTTKTALTSKQEREGEAFFEHIKTSLLAIQNRTKKHEALLIALDRKDLRNELLDKIENYLTKSDSNPKNFLITVATDTPWKLTPKSAAKNSDFSNSEYDELSAEEAWELVKAGER